MTHNNLIAIFVVIAALALLLQAAVMVGIFVSVRKFLAETDNVIRDIRRRTEPLLDAVNGMVQDSREPVRSVLANLSEISRTVKERTTLVDARVAEMADTIRLQVARIDQLIGTFVEKATTTADVLQSGVLGPLYQVSAIIKGMQTGIDYFFSQRRSKHPRQATQDEELFI
ncbi:MAG: hypothetical protein ACREP9_15400 [Candidatus Dormibacteraceae bacterium]